MVRSGPRRNEAGDAAPLISVALAVLASLDKGFHIGARRESAHRRNRAPLLPVMPLGPIRTFHAVWWELFRNRYPPHTIPPVLRVGGEQRGRRNFGCAAALGASAGACNRPIALSRMANWRSAPLGRCSMTGVPEDRTI